MPILLCKQIELIYISMDSFFRIKDAIYFYIYFRISVTQKGQLYIKHARHYDEGTYYCIIPITNGNIIGSAEISKVYTSLSKYFILYQITQNE